MFLNILTDQQKSTFLALATKLIMADHDIKPEEEVTLNVRKAEMGGNVVAPPDQIFGKPDTSVFDDRQSRVIVVLELFVLAYSDDHFHKHEQEVVAHLAKDFGFSADEIAAFEEWAKRQAPLSVQGWNLIGSVDG